MRKAHGLPQTSQVHIIVPLAATASFLAFRLATRAAVRLSLKADMAFEQHCLQTLLSRGAVRNMEGARSRAHTHTHTHTRLKALFPGLPGLAGTRKVKPIWILLKHETVSGNGISWAICKSASRSRQIMHASTPPLKFFTGRMPFLPPNQQRQSTEGTERLKFSNIREF